MLRRIKAKHQRVEERGEILVKIETEDSYNEGVIIEFSFNKSGRLKRVDTTYGKLET